MEDRLQDEAGVEDPDEALEVAEERFRRVMRRNREYNPISSPGLMFEVLRRIEGVVVADVGCGGGLFSHIAKLGWYHTPTYGSVEGRPWIVGVDVNDWTSKSGVRHNYDAFLRGTSDRLRLPDGSVDTVVCIENLEHLTRPEIDRSLEEFDRVARRRIVVTTPSPLRFMPEKLFRERAGMLARRDVHIDREVFAKLASAVHKTCVDPREMTARGYRIELHSGEWEDHPIYVKDLDGHGASGTPPELPRPGADEEVFTVAGYLETLSKSFPFDPPTIARYAEVPPTRVKELREKDRAENNRRSDYLNLVCASLKENDAIPSGSMDAFVDVVARERRATGPGRRAWSLRLRDLAGGWIPGRGGR